MPETLMKSPGSVPVQMGSFLSWSCLLSVKALHAQLSLFMWGLFSASASACSLCCSFSAVVCPGGQMSRLT